MLAEPARSAAGTRRALAVLEGSTAEVPTPAGPAATSCSPAPFGLEPGTSLGDLATLAGGLEERLPGEYTTSTVPRPDPAFTLYELYVTPEGGLRGVRGSGPIRSDAYGDGLREAFDAVRERFDRRYGASLLVDRLRPGSAWKDPRGWLVSLLRGERELRALWTRDGASLPLRAAAIALEAKADCAGAWLKLSCFY